jgi:hypothetical protein
LDRRPIVHVSEPKLYDYGDLDETGDTERFEDVRKQDRRIALALVAVVCALVVLISTGTVLIVRSLR